MASAYDITESPYGIGYCALYRRLPASSVSSMVEEAGAGGSQAKVIQMCCSAFKWAFNEDLQLAGPESASFKCLSFELQQVDDVKWLDYWGSLQAARLWLNKMMPDPLPSFLSRSEPPLCLPVSPGRSHLGALSTVQPFDIKVFFNFPSFSINSGSWPDLQSTSLISISIRRRVSEREHHEGDQWNKCRVSEFIAFRLHATVRRSWKSSFQRFSFWSSAFYRNDNYD